MSIEQPQTDQSHDAEAYDAGAHDAGAQNAGAPDAAALPAVGRRTSAVARHLGFVSLVAVVILIALEAVAITVGAERHWLTATALAWIVILGTAATLVTAVVAIIRRSDRRLAMIAAILSVIANPLVLIGVFALFGAS